MSFTDKVILITGANSGIGQATAEFFAKEGAKLALVGRRAEKFEDVVTNIKNSGVDTEPLIIVADVATDAERIIGESIEKYGRLDVLINNAGFSVYGTLEEMKMEDYDGKLINKRHRNVCVLILSVNIHSYDGNKCARPGTFDQTCYSVSSGN